MPNNFKILKIDTNLPLLNSDTEAILNNKNKVINLAKKYKTGLKNKYPGIIELFFNELNDGRNKYQFNNNQINTINEIIDSGINLGLNNKQISVLLGSALQESNLNPDSVRNLKEGDTKYLFQLEKDVLDKYHEYAKSKNIKPEKVSSQIEFIVSKIHPDLKSNTDIRIESAKKLRSGEKLSNNDREYINSILSSFIINGDSSILNKIKTMNKKDIEKYLLSKDVIEKMNSGTTSGQINYGVTGKEFYNTWVNPNSKLKDMIKQFTNVIEAPKTSLLDERRKYTERFFKAMNDL